MPIRKHLTRGVFPPDPYRYYQFDFKSISTGATTEFLGYSY
jgi:hypothetical protein